MDYAQEQYLSFDHDIATKRADRLRQLAADPRADTHDNSTTDEWTAEFDPGTGIILYILSDTHRRIMVLRVPHLS